MTETICDDVDGNSYGNKDGKIILKWILEKSVEDGRWTELA
jgi:hypothetical protein